MGYSELIKNFDKIREYIRQFYVYGFRSRNEFDLKSARSYDNEHRRVESWLSEYMRFRQNEDGKAVFMSIDSRQTPHNPLHKSFKTKSFTDNDITFHFYLMDLMYDGGTYSLTDILDIIDTDYLSHFEDAKPFDESTVRKKLKEYVNLGIIREEQYQKKKQYRLCRHTVPLDTFSDAVHFFSEFCPLGVIGSYIADKTDDTPCPFCFKHRYIFQVLDSRLLYTLIDAIRDGRDILPRIKGRCFDEVVVHPLKIYISTQNGRQYLLGYDIARERCMFIRLDNLVSVTVAEKNPNRDRYLARYDDMKHALWGVSLSTDNTRDTVRMTIHLDDNEEYIYHRLMREKRCGTVVRTDPHTCVFTAEVYDAKEMLPWIRTFIGRIADFECSNTEVTDTLNADFEALQAMYGGDDGDL